MKIAYFTDTFAPELNGVTNTLSRLSSYLEKKNIQYAFFAPGYDRKPAGGGDGSFENKRVHRFKGIKTSLSPESRLAFPRYRDILETCDEFKPDLVHVVTELGIGYKGLKYARSRGLPLVMSYHTDYCKYLRFFHLDFFKSPVEKYLSWFYRSAHKILTPSKHTLEQLFHKGYQNLGLWSRGIDADTFSPRYRSRAWRRRLGIENKFVFLYVGRLSPEKGLDMLLHAAAEIESRFPGKAAFVFTGDGPYGEILRRGTFGAPGGGCRRNNFPGLILTGFKTGRELSEIYASCDCFAFPSGTETFGNAPLEAMASGLPVAGIAAGGVTEFLFHNQNALLCADGDQRAFTENLITLMENKRFRRALAKNGRSLARSRAWDRIFDDLLGVYAGLIENSGSGIGRGYRDAS
ncbi:MAG: glycosyltransferase family 1 protein [Spirochaetaceae bacterium]|jgi:glycosyltransferase involved in cell wall biosynthesis|nr:glycosyltransferase family 1 protein [Spirochaetaceae bacterium]